MWTMTVRPPIISSTSETEMWNWVSRALEKTVEQLRLDICGLVTVFDTNPVGENKMVKHDLSTVQIMLVSDF